jgi:putative endonuclease
VGKNHYSVYILASKSRTLYIGMTNNLHRRVFEHKNGSIEGFSDKYRCHRLVYYESFDRVLRAIDREKQLKRWNRAKKLWLIQRGNPTWEVLRPSGMTGISLNPNSRFLHSPPLTLRLGRNDTGF